MGVRPSRQDSSPSWTVSAFGAVVAVAIVLVRGGTGLSPDTVTGVFFSSVVALGIAIISRERGLTRNLPAFLYGDPLAVTDAELAWMGALLLLVCAWLVLSYNRVLLLGIHEGFARTKGVPVRTVEVSFALVVALVVTAAIRAVGILLVTALLVIRAAAARNVARAAAPALWISVGIALLSGISPIMPMDASLSASFRPISRFPLFPFAPSYPCPQITPRVPLNQ